MAMALRFALALATLIRAWATLEDVEKALQPVLDQMALKYNMSFSFGFVNPQGRVALAAGVNNIWNRRPLRPDSLVPLGSVTKPWTAVMVMQAVESGLLNLDDPAMQWIDPVMRRLWNKSMEQLWGPQVRQVVVRDLMGMTSGMKDYDDFFLEHFTMAFSGDDAGPMVYLQSAARQGFACAPGSCAMYSGANYVLLGLLLVQVHGMWSWQDLDQLHVIPRELFRSGRYSHTSFSRLGRCAQYPGFAHQYAWKYWMAENGTQVFEDLLYDSCLNGWTMGNIASSAVDLATFFFDLFTLPKEQGGFITTKSLADMQASKTLGDTWCEGPNGEGSCAYGMGILTDQLGQDFWLLQNASENQSKVSVIGHPGEDWGSGCSPCGYNPTYNFGICIAYTSVIGMNCSGDFRNNYNAVQEATCLAYDAVMATQGGPRLNCTLPTYSGLKAQCEWTKHSRQKHNFTTAQPSAVIV
ncbi:unnamed protein product [Effrenium voratum]|nr:unnamed protein product [Effrenium voratum]|eukprot:CAMPEP_0181459368 /NCGR_PEP_ID=MMETSP1110-20121109/32791_1 /TAXON_ID=174948 /ORGANISM="Symbiodinium sp., Strain CCMP421" /LENGTH=466 /DNA_ID=CAMNT_0023583889 /DNA_START=38 /DNA_END=1438 /DNA_ORIENTATION=+